MYEATELQEYNKQLEDRPQASNGSKVHTLPLSAASLVAAGAVIALLVAVFALQIAILSKTCPARDTNTTIGSINDLQAILSAQVNTSFDHTRNFNTILETTGNSTLKLIRIVNALSKVHNTRDIIAYYIIIILYYYNRPTCDTNTINVIAIQIISICTCYITNCFR